MRLLTSILAIFFMLVISPARSQYISFSQLNASKGLSENHVRAVAIDKKGYLWVATIDGLNVYDGYSITTFKKQDRPEIPINDIIHLTCDSRNRLWLGTMEGVAWVDEKRNFHRVVLQDSVKKFACRSIMDTRSYGPVLFTSLGQFYFNPGKRKWERLDWIPTAIRYEKFHDAEPFDEDRILYASDSLVMIIDYGRKAMTYSQPFTRVSSLCPYSDHEVAVGMQHGLIQIADIRTKQIVKEYKLTSELKGKTINSTISEIRRAINGSLLVGTYYAGLVIVDTAGNLSHYTHDPVNSSSIGSNMIWRTLCGPDGEIIIGTYVAGVSMFNINECEAGFTRLFSDKKGDYYDNYVSKMVEDSDGNIWIGALERLIQWNRKSNEARFFYYYSNPTGTGSQSLEIRSLCIDHQNRVWISALGEGVAMLDKNTGHFIKLPRDSTKGPAVASPLVVELYTASDGYIWAGTVSGLYRINSATLKVDQMLEDPLLKNLLGTRVNAFLEDDSGNMWIATSNGVYCYDKRNNRLDHYSKTEGLSSNLCYTLSFDSKGRLYTGTSLGFSVIDHGKIKNFTRENGLKYDFCQGILEDDQERLWIANTKCIVRMDPRDSSLEYFGENAGLTAEGFRMGSYLKSRNGELFWGSRGGINYFIPSQLHDHRSKIHVSIYQADIQDSAFYLSGNEIIRLPYANNNIIFRFTAINLKGSRGIQYQYQLEGYDKTWQDNNEIREARYASLPAGNYIFRVRASVDGVNWVDASDETKLTVITPVWQRWWFITLLTGIFAGVIFTLVKYRNRRFREEREKLETERAINYFASSIQNQNTIDSVMWDVAKNCIGRLGFEDCVVYLLDEDRKVLVQKAAHGPKNPRQFEIDNPIEIPLGKGIVGSVASSGIAEIVPDTTLDPRYIVDDEQRFAEITVPIVADGRVLGIIDCEHSKKGFFTQNHLSILATIASLCANKIIRAKAEEAKKEAEQNLMATRQKMSEVEMQALRAQMNPHFIFNCLNSINRYIVKSDQATASLYLTRFAKLIRLILDNSNNKNVTLSNELEALRLYIEMESLRFDHKFDYTIRVDEDISPESIELPPLVIQPYVENAIWHGLLHRAHTGRLDIHVSRAGDNMIRCIIEDNGVGREKAKELGSKTATTRKSLGMKLTEDRIALLNKHAELNASIEIIDLKSKDNEALGTRVILRIPV